MRIVMIGTGYVGLVSGACFSDFGHTVTCVDKDKSKIDALLAGEIPIFEPGLDQLVADNVRAGRLSFAVDGAEAIRNSEIVFIAVGTPTRRGDGHADLSYVYAAAEEIAGLIDGALLGRMREGAVFLNTGRGRTVNEADLMETLRRRPDLTALLDVTHPEPPAADSPLFHLPNVRVTTHIAGSLNDEVHRLADFCLDEFDRYARGEPLRHAVTLEMLTTMA